MFLMPLNQPEHAALNSTEPGLMGFTHSLCCEVSLLSARGWGNPAPAPLWQSSTDAQRGALCFSGSTAGGADMGLISTSIGSSCSFSRGSIPIKNYLCIRSMPCCHLYCLVPAGGWEGTSSTEPQGRAGRCSRPDIEKGSSQHKPRQAALPPPHPQKFRSASLMKRRDSCHQEHCKKLMEITAVTARIECRPMCGTALLQF